MKNLEIFAIFQSLPHLYSSYVLLYVGEILVNIVQYFGYRCSCYYSRETVPCISLCKSCDMNAFSTNKCFDKFITDTHRHVCVEMNIFFITTESVTYRIAIIEPISFVFVWRSQWQRLDERISPVLLRIQQSHANQTVSNSRWAKFIVKFHVFSPVIN